MIEETPLLQIDYKADTTLLTAAAADVHGMKHTICDLEPAGGNHRHESHAMCKRTVCVRRKT